MANLKDFPESPHQPPAMRYTIATEVVAEQLTSELQGINANVLFVVGPVEFPSFSIPTRELGMDYYHVRARLESDAKGSAHATLYMEGQLYTQAKNEARIVLITTLWAPHEMLINSAHRSFTSQDNNELRALEDAIFPWLAKTRGVRWLRKLTEPYGLLAKHIQIPHLP